jgi:hypothetical protein
LPRAAAMPISPPLPVPLVDLPMVPDVFDPVALGIVSDSAAVRIGVPGRAATVVSREKRRMERQKMVVGVLAAAVVVLVIAALFLTLGGGSSESERSGSAAPAKKTHATKPAASPEALEAREGIERLDSPKPKPSKINVEAPRKSIATDFGHVKTTATSASTKAVAPKKPREPKPGTPEADFGLPMVDE